MSEEKEFWKTKVEAFSGLKTIYDVKKKYEEFDKNLKNGFVFAANVFFNPKYNNYDMLIWIKEKPKNENKN